MEEQTKKTKASDLDEMWGESWKQADRINLIKSIHKHEIRRWILKYAPIKGKILEAGCGLGQYVFYFNEFGFDCDGIDISKYTIESNKRFAIKQGYNPEIFKIADVRALSYQDNSILYYLSLGVIEHFKEGPMDALEEAFRVLKPGGIAFIATPNKHNFNWIFKIHKIIKRIIKKILIKLNLLKIKKNLKSEKWVEYRWDINELKSYVENSGFIVQDAYNVGLKFSFAVGIRHRKNLLRKIVPILFPILDYFEDTLIGKLGGNNIIIACKPSTKMHCFFCEEMYHTSKLYKKLQVPACEKCLNTIPEKILINFQINKRPFYKRRCYKKEILNREKKCHYCGKSYKIKPLFGDFGFSIPVCRNCMKEPLINLELRNLELKYTNIGGR